MRLSNATPSYPHIIQTQSLSSTPHTPSKPLRKFEPKALHTTLVLINGRRTVLLGILRIAKQHTLIASSLLVFTHTAWLFSHISKLQHIPINNPGLYLWLGSFGRGLEISS